MSVFPLPLLLIPARPSSSSRRAHQSYARARVVYTLSNACVRAINTLHFNYPSSRYCASVSYLSASRSAGPSSVQQRMLSHILDTTAALIQRSRRQSGVTTGLMIPGPSCGVQNLLVSDTTSSVSSSCGHRQPSAPSLFIHGPPSGSVAHVAGTASSGLRFPATPASPSSRRMPAGLCHSLWISLRMSPWAMTPLVESFH